MSQVYTSTNPYLCSRAPEGPALNISRIAEGLALNLSWRSGGSCPQSIKEIPEGPALNISRAASGTTAPEGQALHISDVRQRVLPSMYLTCARGSSPQYVSSLSVWSLEGCDSGLRCTNEYRHLLWGPFEVVLASRGRPGFRDDLL